MSHTDERYATKFPERARSMLTARQSDAPTIFPQTHTPLRQSHERGQGLLFISHTGKLHLFQSQKELQLLLEVAKKKSNLPTYILRDETGLVSDPASYSDAPSRDKINAVLVQRTGMNLDQLARCYNKQERTNQVTITPVSAGVIVRRRKGLDCRS